MCAWMATVEKVMLSNLRPRPGLEAPARAHCGTPTVLDRPVAPLYTPLQQDRTGEQRDGSETQGNRATRRAEKSSEARS